jgi:hypothetical protein
MIDSNLLTFPSITIFWYLRIIRLRTNWLRGCRTYKVVNNKLLKVWILYNIDGCVSSIVSGITVSSVLEQG